MRSLIDVVARLVALTALLLLASTARAQMSDGPCRTWWPGFRQLGFDGRVRALCVHRPHGSGAAELYAGGEFTMNSDTAAAGVARWNGTSWSNLGSGIPGVVLSLCEHDDGSGVKLYAGGLFQVAGGTQAFSIASWDGDHWSAVGGGLSGNVHALCSFDDGTGPALYAGGEFTVPGDPSGARIARWDGVHWSVLGGGTDSIVWALAVHDDGAGPKLYAAGSFSSAGSVSAQKIACWSGSAWQALGSGLDASAYALASHGGELWVGGDFGFAGGVSVSYVARWDGAHFHPGGTLNARVWRLASLDLGGGPTLYAGGDFYSQVRRFDGTNWVPLTAAPVYVAHDAFAAFDSGSGLELIVARTSTGSVQSTGREVARQTGTWWYPLGTYRRRENPVVDVATWQDPQTGRPLLFVTDRDGSLSDCVQSWDGVVWRSYFGVGHPFSDVIRLLSVARDAQGEALFVGGLFTRLGSVDVRSIARFDGVNLTPMGGGLFTDTSPSTGVYDVESFDSGSGPEVHAAGDFQQSSLGGVPYAVPYVGRWNGSSWSALPGGPNRIVRSLCVFDSGTGARLYAAGDFDQLGGNPSTPVAAWDGVNWSSVGAPGSFPYNGPVKGLVVHDDGSGPALYALASDSSFQFRHLVRWRDPVWEIVVPQIGSGTASITDVVSWDDGSGGGARLYFSLENASQAESVSCWTGTRLQSVAGGVNSKALALGVFPSASGGSDLFVGGEFGSAGSPPVDSWGLARFIGCGPISSFCAGDGQDANVTTPCPCANFGAPGHGCAWSNNPSGAWLTTTGTQNPDSLVLHATGMPASTGATVFWKGSALVPQATPWGDGLRCIDGSLVRLGTKTNVSGAAQYPEGANASISLRGQTPVGSGAVGYYQTTFRNAASYCTPATHNATNAVRVVW